jgi:hypothetical protein
VDIGKYVFRNAGLDPAGHPMQTATFRRDTALQFFKKLSVQSLAWWGAPVHSRLQRSFKALATQFGLLLTNL